MNRYRAIGIIGAGRVTRFLLDGWAAHSSLPAGISVADCNAEVAAALWRDHPSIAVCDAAAAAASDLLVLAVHPPVMMEVLEAIRPRVRPGAVVLSLVPKIGCAKIAAALGVTQVARMIPNAPSVIGRGFNPVAFADGIDPQAKVALMALAAAWGEAPEVPEAELEAYAVLSAMGPTYLWFQWQTLRELGREFGLSPQATDRALLRMIEGAAATLLGSGRDSAAVMDMVPVRPFAEIEDQIKEAYRTRLAAIYQKLRS